jgi:hypothetical protein
MALDPAQQNHATIGIFPQIAAPKPVTLVIPEATNNYSGAEFTYEITTLGLVHRLTRLAVSETPTD